MLVRGMAMTQNYYAQNLNSTKLFQVYDTNIPRVQQYLNTEIDFVKSNIKNDDRVLEIGCGYGRILKRLSAAKVFFTGIDISAESIKFGKEYLAGLDNIELMEMDALKLNFSNPFDVVLCLQNGLSAVKGDPSALIGQTLKVLKPQGKAFFSTYADTFWNDRLTWFEEQAEKGLLGKIDYEQTKNGFIVCEDGFTAKTFTKEDLSHLGELSGFKYEITTVDDSSVFLVITKESIK